MFCYGYVFIYSQGDLSCAHIDTRTQHELYILCIIRGLSRPSNTAEFVRYLADSLRDFVPPQRDSGSSMCVAMCT